MQNYNVGGKQISLDLDMLKNNFEKNSPLDANQGLQKTLKDNNILWFISNMIMLCGVAGHTILF